jgi:hypothetical protein
MMKIGHVNLQNLQVNDAVEIVFALIDGAKVNSANRARKQQEFNDEWEIEGVKVHSTLHQSRLMV